MRRQALKALAGVALAAAAGGAAAQSAWPQKPVRLLIEMSNSAGVFQLDQLFREKLSGSGLERYIELEARIEAEEEKRLFQRFRQRPIRFAIHRFQTEHAFLYGWQF